MARLHVHEEGDGPRVVLLHGAVLFGKLTWGAQLTLAQKWTVVVVERAGYGRSHELSVGEDIETDPGLRARTPSAG